MTDKPNPVKPDDPEQSKRFIDMAREVGVDERADAFEKAFKKVVTPSDSLPDPSGKPT
jgi:hypothetical protein